MSTTNNNYGTGFNLGGSLSNGIYSLFNSVANFDVGGHSLGSATKATFNTVAGGLGTGVDLLTGAAAEYMSADSAKVLASIATLAAGSYLASGNGLVGMGMFAMSVAAVLYSSDIIKPESAMGKAGEFMFGPSIDYGQKIWNGDYNQSIKKTFSPSPT